MTEIAIVDGVRTPQGMLGGVFRTLTAQKLGEVVVRALTARARLETKLIDEVIFGCVGQTSDAPNIARVIALMAGLPNKIPGYTVARNCASGIQAIVNGFQSLICGDAEVLIAGGAESMSSQPYLNRDLRFGKHLKNSELIDSLWEGLTDPICGQLMGRTAENLVEEFKLTRQEQDQFAVLSHQRAFRATREQRFKDEIVPVPVPKKAFGKELPPEMITQDEGINVGLTEQILSQYPAVFKENGSVTPGNSCPISDGSAAILLMTAKKTKELGYTPMGFIRGYAFAGLEPHRMGLGPTLAVPAVLKKTGLSLEQMELIELNEAFAAQYLACERVLGLIREKTNVNGGAIALGHPVGTSGTRIVVTLLHEMKKRNLHFGLATLCVGGGQGAAIIVER
jgi:acetyl-CoA C-acetyltransferase